MPLSDLPASLMAPRRHIFLSPHYDDIPLSAGATVRLLADRGFTPETLVVFGTEPDPAQSLSTFATDMHTIWGLDAGEVVAHRQSEERAAAEILGSMTGVLPFRDAIYRGHVYLSDDDLFGEPAASEVDLPEAIMAALNLGNHPDPGVRIYAPLAIGRHVDHQIVFQAAARLAETGWDVWLYEDIPYALKPGALERRLAEVGNTVGEKPAARIPASATWDAKLDAILSYPSQLETIFRQYVGVGTSRAEIGEAIGEYASAAGEGVLAERFWNVNNAPSRGGS
jgi:LmbE family N-acetylglucosaminyl deacetylase